MGADGDWRACPGRGAGDLRLQDPHASPRLEIESEVEKLLPDDGEELALYQRFRERFGSDSILFVGMVTDDVFSAENLRRIRRMTKRFAQVDGIREVVSLSNAPDIKFQDGSVSIQSVFDEVPSDPAEQRPLRESVLNNPLHVGRAVPRMLQDALSRKTVLRTVENTRKWVDSDGRWRP